jgi:hypothetical protein
MNKNKSVLDMAAAQVPARTISVTLNIPVRTVYRVIKETKWNKIRGYLIGEKTTCAAKLRA